MVTYDEAIEARHGKTREELAARHNYEKYEDILNEVTEHPRTIPMMRAIVSMSVETSLEAGVSPDNIVLSMVMSAYLNGIVIGLEMNKHD